MADKIVGIVVAVECTHCKGEGSVPGGQYQREYGERITCPVCKGRGWNSSCLSIRQIRESLILDEVNAEKEAHERRNHP